MNIKDIILDRSIPEYIRENYPQFELFLSAYYEWMEQEKNGIDLVKNLQSYHDIDETLDEFYDYFMRDYAASMPNNIKGDKATFLKYAKNFYKNKGNLASFKFLFRLLFNEDIQIFYPKTKILRASNGKWQQQITVKLLQSSVESVLDLFKFKIVGNTSHSNAVIESIFSYTELGQPIYELNLTNIRGTFPTTDTYTCGAQTFSILETLFYMNIDDGGSGYGVSETFDVFQDGEKIASGKIDATSRGAVQSLEISNGGTGYHGNQKIVDHFVNLPLGYVWNGNDFMNLPLSSMTGYYDLYNSTLDFVIDDVLIDDTGDVIQIVDSPEIVGTGANGVVTLVSSSGEILEIELLNGGREYNIPLASVISSTGSGAVINAIGGGGTMTVVSLDNFPAHIFETNENITVTINSQNGINGQLSPVWGGSLVRYRGDWINDDGKLSSSVVLEDNDYYQDFSYDILTAVPMSKWKDVLQRVAHPAGFKMFGSLVLTASVDTGSASIAYSSIEQVGRVNVVTQPVNLVKSYSLPIDEIAINITASDVS